MIKKFETEEEQELFLASQLQSALLPRKCPVGCGHQLTSAKNRMVESIGGDFYDFLRINDEQIALVIGDIVGHGVRASLLMANIMGWLRSEPGNLSKPAKLISNLNLMLVELGDRLGSPLPCSMFYIVIDQPSGTAFFVNGGHPRPFLCERDRCVTLPLGARNMLLGVQEFEPEEGCNVFSPGQRLVLYTDGITDAVNANGQRFGRTRLGHLINECHELAPDELTEKIFASLDEFRNGFKQIDDETIVVYDRI